MKKTARKVVALLAAVAAACGLTVSVYGAGTVTYNADADKFIFEPGSAYAPTDLFSEYKGVMPGDSIKQDITVKNDSSNGVKVKMYIRSRGAREDSVDFLSRLHLTVEKAAENEMAYMFDAAADRTDGMTDWVYLGTLYSGGEVNLVLKLDVPIDLGDEYQDATGYIDWEFKVEELPVEPEDPLPPHTGDDSHVYLYAILALLSAAALVILIPKWKKQPQKADE